MDEWRITQTVVFGCFKSVYLYTVMPLRFDPDMGVRLTIAGKDVEL
jgi:hypothetical protein